MARKSSKVVSEKKHSPIPVKEAPTAASPKKAAEVVKVSATIPPVMAETPSTPVAAATVTAAAPVSNAPAEKISSTIDHAEVSNQIAALRSNDADIARDAATALGRLGCASAVEPLIEVLSDNENYFHSVVRAAAASSLAQLKDARAFEPLVNAVRGTMAEASAEAVRALTTMGDARAVGVLVDVVRNQDGFYLSTVRLAAVEGLKKLGGETAKAELAQVAANQWEDAVIRETAGGCCGHCE
jgi:HEAT repeat protein